MRVAVLLGVLWAVRRGWGFDKVVTETQGHAGTCYLIGSAVAGFQLPAAPIIALEAAIYLAKLPQNLNDYPPLRPKVYVRYDGFASATQYEHSVEAGPGWTLILVEFLPPASKWLTFRLDGGLNHGLFMQPAKALHNWFYYVELSPTVIPVYLPVLPQTGQITIRIQSSAPVELIASPDNYLNIPASNLTAYTGEVYYFTVTDTAVLTNPRPGPWFLVFRVDDGGDFTYEIDSLPCFQRGGEELCGDSPTEYVKELQQFFTFSYESIELDYSGTISSEIPKKQHYFVAAEENMGRRYALKLYFEYGNTAEMTKSEYFAYILSSLQVDFTRGSPSFPFLSISDCVTDPSPCNPHETSSGLGLFLYLDQIPPGLIYFSLSLPLLPPAQSIPYSYGVGYSDCGADMCNGDFCNLIVDAPVATHWCDCERNHSGLDCLSQSVSDVEYGFWVVLLVGSNCAMALAVWKAVWGVRTYAEGVVFAVTMGTSGVYHVCDTQFYCFGAHAPSLRLCDFYMSYFSITVSLIYLARIQRQEVKFAFVLLYAILLVFCGVIWDFGTFWTEIMAPLSAGIVPAAVWGRFVALEWRRNGGKWWRVAFVFLFRSGNFRWKYGLTALLTFTLAITSKELETNYNYWVVSPHADTQLLAPVHHADAVLRPQYIHAYDATGRL